MLKFNKIHWLKSKRGDTLIEVTFALAILGFVLLGSTSIAAAAFRTGQTARERTQVAEAAQQQMEALRSFRDNHSWGEFRSGKSGVYLGVDNARTGVCQFDPTKRCFYMALVTTAPGTTEWVPRPGSTTSIVPTSVIEITSDTDTFDRQCGYDFELQYTFTPLGGGGGIKARNQIKTRLANLKYDPNGQPVVCP